MYDLKLLLGAKSSVEFKDQLSALLVLLNIIVLEILTLLLLINLYCKKLLLDLCFIWFYSILCFNIYHSF